MYRAVQEALTNCVKHAGASRIEVAVHGGAQSLDVSVTDDGVGVAPARRGSGLGLLGIDERVRELDGSMDIRTSPGAGTTVTIHLPLPPRASEVPSARAAG